MKDIQVVGLKDDKPLFGGKTRDDGVYISNVSDTVKTVTIVITDPSNKYNSNLSIVTIPED